jgi:peptidoglycan biosynthesis protein MviN/MurJ (putative lipid II flippase)
VSVSARLKRLVSRPNLHRDHLSILAALVSVSSFVLVAKGVGAAKEVAVAAKYGTAAAADAYTLIFNLMTAPVFAWQQILILVLVPLLLKEHDERDSTLFRRELWGLGILIGVGLAVILGGGLWLALSENWIAASSAVKHESLVMVWPLAILVPLGMGSGYFAATMMSGKRLVNSLFEGIPSLVLLIALVVLPQVTAMPLIVGTILGYVAQLVVSAVTQPEGRGAQWPRIGNSSTLWPIFWQSFALVAVSQVVLTITNSVLDQVMVASLGPTANAVLGYANRLMTLVLGLGATAIARATLPIFSSRSDLAHQSRLASRWTVIILVAGLFAFAAGWLLAPFGVRLLFKHGAFSEQDAISVTEVLRFNLIQVPFAFAAAVPMQMIASRGRYGLFFWSSLIQLPVKYFANVVLIGAFGVAGAAMASGLRAAVAFVLILIYLKWRKMPDGSPA